jgi:hypothetical protein
MRWFALLVLAGCTSNVLGPAGSSVTLRGRISQSPKQSIAFAPPDKVMEHFDYAPDRQVVVYWAQAPACSGEIEIVGVVKLEQGTTKRPGSTEPYSERVVDVETARCVE